MQRRDPGAALTTSANAAKVRGMNYAIWTIGCQMNKADSEQVELALLREGLSSAPEADADVIVINTCVVRGNAEDRSAGKLSSLLGWKRRKPAPAGGHGVPGAAGAVGASCGLSPCGPVLHGARVAALVEAVAGAQGHADAEVGRPTQGRMAVEARGAARPVGRGGVRAHHLWLQQLLRLLHRAVSPRARASAAAWTRF